MSVLNREIRTNFEGHLKKGSVEEELFQQIDCQRIPRHVAIIMDGNGRWAQKGVFRVWLATALAFIRSVKLSRPLRV